MVRTTLTSLTGKILRHAPVVPPLAFHPAVAEALASRQRSSKPATPIIALESTIITHGMPFPATLETAKKVEEEVRQQGAIPATIAILDGRIHVGLTDAQLDRLGEAAKEKSSSVKTGRRDIAAVLAQKKLGGTTVSGTSAIAKMADIEIFATGGIGGVHRGAAATFDVSSDLTELARTRMAVFCSGAKSILDIPLTLEYLETHGVSTYSFNPTGEFPGFYSRQSGRFVTAIRDETEAASVILQSQMHSLESGSVFGVPIPQNLEPKGAEIQRMVEQAVAEAEAQGISRRQHEVTPWLLTRVGQLTKGTSLESNIGLVINNARVAARTAKAYELLRFERQEDISTLYSGLDKTDLVEEAESPMGLVFGCAALDVVSRADSLQPRSTSPGRVEFSLGGVARNIAETASKIAGRGDIRLVAPLANDVAGDVVRHGLSSLGMDMQGLILTDNARFGPTSPVCVLQLDVERDLVAGTADMSLVEEALDTFEIRKALERSHGARVVAFDANIRPQGMVELLKWRDLNPQTALVFEPTSTAKCSRVIDAMMQLRKVMPEDHPATIDVTTPNARELRVMAQRASDAGVVSAYAHETSANGLSAIQLDCLTLSTVFKTILVTLGEEGVLVASRDNSGLTSFEHISAQALSAGLVRSTTGAGDSFTGGIVAYLTRHGLPTAAQQSERAEMVEVGQAAARLTLQSTRAVADDMTSCASLLDASSSALTRTGQ